MIDEAKDVQEKRECVCVKEEKAKNEKEGYLVLVISCLQPQPVCAPLELPTCIRTISTLRESGAMLTGAGRLTANQLPSWRNLGQIQEPFLNNLPRYRRPEDQAVFK